MISVTRKFTFEAAHHLPKHEGLCHNQHGHSYILEITVQGDITWGGPQDGMIMDFSNLKQIVTKDIIDTVDHSNLNDWITNPTAEIMVQTIANSLSPFIDVKYPFRRLSRVRLYETANAYAEWNYDKETA